MVASPRVERLKYHLPALGGLAAGVIAAVAIVLLPASVLESMVWDSGIASLVPAADPPLGMAARIALSLGGGAVVAAIIWSILYLLIGPGGLLVRRRDPAAPLVRRADAHPDAPPRRPLFATEDLGTPLMDVHAAPAVRPLPQDLDLPLAAFDPTAVPETPRAPAEPVAALAQRPQVFDPGDRLETFELTPVVRPALSEAATAAPPPSVETLLRRLEQAAKRRERPPLSLLDEALGSLRSLAG